MEVSENIEVTERRKDGKSLWFVLNHGDEEKTFSLPCRRRELLTGQIFEKGEEVSISKKGVLILEE